MSFSQPCSHCVGSVPTFFRMLLHVILALLKALVRPIQHLLMNRKRIVPRARRRMARGLQVGAETFATAGAYVAFHLLVLLVLILSVGSGQRMDLRATFSRSLPDPRERDLICG